MIRIFQFAEDETAQREKIKTLRLVFADGRNGNHDSRQFKHATDPVVYKVIN